MVLAGYSIFLLLLGFTLGLGTPRARFWNWVDAIYYPLAIFGVLLLYFEDTPLRSIVSIEESHAELVFELREIDATRPSGDMKFSSKKTIQNGGEWLRFISSKDESCDSVTGSLTVCSVVDVLAPITMSAERLLLGYEGPKDIGNICKSAGEIFTRMSEDRSLSTFLMIPIAEHFFQGMEKGFFDTDYKRVQAYIDELNPKLENEIKKKLDYLSLNENDEAILKPIYEEEVLNGLIVMKAFEVCLRAPAEIRSGKYATWVERSKAKQNEIDSREQELRNLRLSAQNIE